LHYAAATGLLTLADDSGLEVDRLGGEPGVHSAYYAGVPRDDLANNRKLIEKLRGVPVDDRTARFRCALALASPGGVVHECSGKIEGFIVDEARGTKGFGYDPHFLVPSLNRTLAELTREEKNAISHRGAALRQFLAWLQARAAAKGGVEFASRL
jgi:XTP/dITP diphosphohydrolase